MVSAALNKDETVLFLAIRDYGMIAVNPATLRQGSIEILSEWVDVDIDPFRSSIQVKGENVLVIEYQGQR